MTGQIFNGFSSNLCRNTKKDGLILTWVMSSIFINVCFFRDLGRWTVSQLSRFRACLQGGMVTNFVPRAFSLAWEGYLSKWAGTLAGGQKIARVYKQNFTGTVTLQPGRT